MEAGDVGAKAGELESRDSARPVRDVMVLIVVLAGNLRAWSGQVKRR